MDNEQDHDSQSAERASPGKARKAMRLAQAALDQGDATTAISHLQAAAAEDPDNKRAWKRLGQALREADRHEEAETAFRRLLELAPDDPKARFAAAEMKMRQGRHSEAAADLTAAAASHPEDVKLNLTVGMKLVAQLRGEEAAMAFRRVLAVEPTNFMALRGLGRIALYAGEDEEALAMFKAAEASAPGDPQSIAAIKRIEGTDGDHDWKAEVREAITILNSESDLDKQVWAAQVLVIHGMTELVQKVLTPLEDKSKKLRRLLQMARQMDQMGLSQSFQNLDDPDVDQLNSLTGYVERLRPGAETLVLFFSGGADRAFLSLDVMHRVLRTTGASLVYLRDLKRTRYIAGVVGLGEDFVSVAGEFRKLMARSGASRLLTIGHCGGASASLRYGLALKAAAVLAIAPQILSASVMENLPPRGAAKIAALQKAAGPYSADLPTLYGAADNPPRATIISGGDNDLETRFGREMAAKAPSVVAVEMPGSKKGSMSDILTLGLLSPMLSSFVAGGVVPKEILDRIGSPAPPIAA